MKNLNLEENDDEEPANAFADLNDHSPAPLASGDKSMM